MENKKLIGIFILVIITSLIIPKVVLYFLEENNVEEMYQVSLNMFYAKNINSENALIKTIYSKYTNEKYNISTSDEFSYTVPYYEINGKQIENKVLIKLSELESLGMIKDTFFEYIKSNENMIFRTNRFYNESINYSKIRVFLPADNYSTTVISFEVENKTAKIISLKIPREYIISTKDVMQDYVQYLDLKGNDWVYGNNSIRSVSNGIEIKIEDINNIVSISIVPYNT